MMKTQKKTETWKIATIMFILVASLSYIGMPEEVKEANGSSPLGDSPISLPELPSLPLNGDTPYIPPINGGNGFLPVYSSSGVCTSDFHWAEPHGSFFTQYHLDLIKSSGGKTVFFLINYGAWETNPTCPATNKPYQETLETLTEYGKSIGLYICMSLARWNIDGGQDTYLDKVAVIRNENGRQDKWVQWGKEVIQQCHPTIIGIMGETTGVVGFQEYYDFCYRCLTEWKPLDSNLWFMAYGGCWSEEGNGRPLEVWKWKPLPYSKVFYDAHQYYDPESTYHPPSDFDYSYEAGNLALAKQQLYAWMDSVYGDLENVWWGEFGGWRKVTEKDHRPNWDQFIRDVLDYCRQNNMGCTQFGFTKGTYTMLTSDSMSLNEVGIVWRDNL